MELLIFLIIGLGIGYFLAAVYIKEETKRKNRERWRKNYADRKAKRGR